MGNRLEIAKSQGGYFFYAGNALTESFYLSPSLRRCLFVAVFCHSERNSPFVIPTKGVKRSRGAYPALSLQPKRPIVVKYSDKTTTPPCSYRGDNELRFLIFNCWAYYVSCDPCLSERNFACGSPLTLYGSFLFTPLSYTVHWSLLLYTRFAKVPALKIVRFYHFSYLL